jgi:hypothetical protein
MERSRRNPAIQRILATQEYRVKKPIDKAFMLHQGESVSKLEAAVSVGVSRSTFDRAKRAREDGREIGINGHPTIFNNEDTTALISRFHLLRETNQLTIDDIRNVVRTLLPLKVIFSEQKFR